MNKLKHMSLDIYCLNAVFEAMVVSRITYALPAFSGHLLQGDVSRIDSIFKKAKRWAITSKKYSTAALSAHADQVLFKKSTSPGHCLFQIIPQLKINNRYNLRPNSKKYDVPFIKQEKLLNSFVYRVAK